MLINEKLQKLDSENSFYKASSKIREYKSKHPECHFVSLGIGDVCFPVSKCIAKKMIKAVKVEASDDFVGYGNHYGIPELIEAIRAHEYPNFSKEEIYISDGTKTDSGNLLELFNRDSKIGIFAPTYPIYNNSALSLDRDYEIIDCDNNFDLVVPKKHFDVLYICSPNNPTGINYSLSTLKRIIDYAINEKCVILYDNVYFKFITSGVHSIYEIKGAEKCAIEMRSFSKHASFTGIRCSYYVIPNSLHKNINQLWKMRTINRFNGASYIAQVGALASYDDSANKYIEKNIQYYKNNAKIMKDKFLSLGYEVSGGTDAPYLWIKCKNNMSSWEVFDLFLKKLNVIVVPGIIFGEQGDSYFRVSALGKRNEMLLALERIEKYEQDNI